MIRKLLYLLVATVLLVWTNDSLQAQAIHNHAQCGVGFQDGQAIKNRMLQNRRDQAALLEKFDQGRGNDSTVWVPIQFHIVQKTNGTGGEKVSDVLANLCKLNADYLHLNVEFYLAGPIRFIKQDLLYTNDFGAMASFYMGMYKQDGVVNVFIGDNIQNPNSGGTTLGYYTSALDVIYCIRSAINGSSSTLTHELGHFFSLPHTFFGWENQNYETVMQSTTGRTPTFLPSGAEVEKIVRSGGKENCQIAGDAFCDTEANYLFGFYGGSFNNGCTYAATAHDPYGILFLPSVIAPNAVKFKMEEGKSGLTSLVLKNNSNKSHRIHPKTLIVIETEFTLGGTTTQMWQDTIGDSDSTDIYIAGSGSTDDILAGGSRDVVYGFINMGSYLLDLNVSSANTNLSFIAAPGIFEAQGTSTTTTLDSIRVTNTSTTDTVFSGTLVNIQEVLMNGATQTSSETWTRALPNDLAPGQSYTFLFADLIEIKTTTAGVVFNVKSYAPSQVVTDPTSKNIMSYYQDACVFEFTPEQGAAMKADIASRGFATLYSEPSDITLTNQVVATNPTNGAVAPYPMINFTWNAVNGATMYYVWVYQRNVTLGGPLAGGEQHELMVSGTDFWLTLDPTKNYAWKITPLNATNFCDASLASAEMIFTVNDWTVGVDKVAGTIASSTLYPNPSRVSNEVVVEINATQASEATISVFNSLGQRMMLSQSLPLIAGTNVQKLNTAALPTGLYVVTIKTADGLVSHKLQIQD